MRKIYLLGAALMALTWTSCTQDDSLNYVNDDNSVFTGEMEFVGSRTSLGEDNKISWVLEDELSIFKKNNINRQYKVASIDNGKATFSYLDNVTPATIEDITGNYAIYPYSENNSIATDGTISAPIKAEYTYTDRSSFISSALLAATSTGTNFSFKNVQGYLRLRLCAEIPEDYAAVESVTLTSATKNLSGIAEITWSTDGIPSASIKDEGAGHSLTVKLDTPESLPSKASGNYLELYVPVVPMTFNQDEVSLTINFEGDDSYTKKNSSAITIARREVTGVKLTVGVDDNFTGDMEGFEEVWDGETVTVPTPVTENGETYYPVVKASDLAGIAALVNGTQSRAVTSGEMNVKLMNDIDLGGKDWTPIGISTDLAGGKTFRGTFDGNGHVIKNLVSKGTDVAGLFGYVYAATIKNVTVESATITSNHFAGGIVAWVNNVQGNVKAPFVIENCHVNNSTITSAVVNGDNGDKVGGLIGYACFGNADWAANSEAKISGCSVKNTAVKAYRDFAGLVGYASYTTIENCDVENVTLTQDLTDDYKAPDTPTTFGMMIGRDDCYNTIDGIYVAGNATSLQKAIDKNVEKINVIADISGDVKVTQKADVKIAINGNEHNFKGLIVVDGKSATYTTAGLTIKDLTFNAETISNDACIRLGDGTNETRYTCNVTVDNCTFDVPGAVGVKSYTGGDKNLTIKNSTATIKAHSLVQAKGIDGILIEKCTVESKNGMNFNNSTNVTIIECTTDVKGYAARFGEGASDNGIAEVYTIKNSTLKSACDDGDAVIVLRGTADNSTLTIENTTLNGNIKITNNATDAKVTVDGKVSASSQGDLNDALENKNDVSLAEGNYTLPSVNNGDVTISGTKEVVITIDKPNYSGSNVTLEGVTVKGSGYATGIQHVNTVTYKDVAIVGEMCLYGEKVVFNNCTFELNAQYIWTYGAKEVEFNNCTFNTTGKAILIYNEGAGASKVTVKGCTFNATAGAKAGAIANQNCAAIEIDNFQSSGTGAAHELITNGNTCDSNFSGEWRIKNFVAGNAVTVNGNEYEQIAIDGKLMTIDSGKNVTIIQ